ncbi:MAG: ATP-binding cassette domain-containing protein [Alphaproteobacteria bacterium]|nr:ATP-binding cassette domain-containing protein [Alphaproteobacteria bacterium]OJV13696.1 MAG: hypothetical protein BGO27_00805 [Alphaproteobacteria bacterium 33-17]
MSKFSSPLRSLIIALDYVKPFKYELVGVMVSLAISSSSVLGIGDGIGSLIDKGFAKNDYKVLNEALIILLAVSIVLAIATFFRSFLISNICEKVVAKIRQDAFSVVVGMPVEFFESHKISDIITRLTNDTTLLTNIITALLSVAIRNMILLIGGLVLLVKTSVFLSIIVLGLMPLVVIPIVIVGRKVRTLSKDALAKISEISERVEESLRGILTVQVFNREAYEKSILNGKVDEALHAAQERIFLRALLVALVIAIVFGSISFVLWIGGHEVIDGKLTSGSLSSFVFYAVLVASSSGALAETLSEFQKAHGAVDRIFHLLAYKSNIKDPESPKIINVSEFSSINFDNISFAYPSNPSKNVLSNFSLSINKGETIAFVGLSGSGKSTIFNLLLRLYDLEYGEVKINDINIKNILMSDLRRHFAIVPQETVIFSATIYDNIKYGNLNASFEDVVQASIAAEIHEFIEGLPEKYHTFVGEKGMRLSGGQKQRIAIARAILKNAPILLLDEATSNLDSENEQLIQKGLARLMAGRTTLVIAHRLSTIENADKIVVLDGGEVSKMGTHDELLSTSDIYKKLAKV